MRSPRPNPLDIPEIIALVGQFIPLWRFSIGFDRSTSSIRNVFQPHDLLSAVLVNRTFHRTLTPLLWQVYDDSLVYDIDSDGNKEYYLDDLLLGDGSQTIIPSHLFLANCHHFRIFHNHLREFRKARTPSPLQQVGSLETCIHLRELTLSWDVQDEFACELVSRNPMLRLLSWECSRYNWPVMRQRNYEALSVLHHLESLHLDRWAIDHEKLCNAVLRRNAASLKELSFMRMLGFRSEEVWDSFIGGSQVKDQEEEENNSQDGDRQRYGGNGATAAPPNVLFSKLKTLRLECQWNISTIASALTQIEGVNVKGRHDDTDSNDTITSSENTALPGLLRLCPTLESLFLLLDSHCDTDRVGRLLREYCPRLNTIRCVNSYLLIDSENSFLKDNYFVSLIQGCAPLPSLSTASALSAHDADVFSETQHNAKGRTLKYFEMGLFSLNTTITSALLVHASSLQVVDLHLPGNKKIDIENACRLLLLCPRLKRFAMRGSWLNLDGLLLFEHEWACQQLESLHFDGFSDAYPPVDGIFSSKNFKPFVPAHWRIMKRWFSDYSWRQSAGEDMFQRALFKHVDSMPSLVNLNLNMIPFMRTGQATPHEGRSS